MKVLFLDPGCLGLMSLLFFGEASFSHFVWYNLVIEDLVHLLLKWALVFSKLKQTTQLYYKLKDIWGKNVTKKP